MTQGDSGSATMTRPDFKRCMDYVSHAIQKWPGDETLEVYFDLLGDLGYDVLRAACKRVVLEHKWATFPTVAELREAAVEVQAGDFARMPAQAAWSLACRAVEQIDLEFVGEFVVFEKGQRVSFANVIDYALAKLPPSVAATLRSFGVGRLLSHADPIGVLQAQFCQTYNELLTAAKRGALLPLSVRNEIASVAVRSIAGAIPIGKAVALIGKRVEQQAC